MDDRRELEFKLIKMVLDDKKDLSVEILHQAMLELKQDGSISIEQAILYGIAEWDK